MKKKLRRQYRLQPYILEYYSLKIKFMLTLTDWHFVHSTVINISSLNIALIF